MPPPPLLLSFFAKYNLAIDSTAFTTTAAAPSSLSASSQPHLTTFLSTLHPDCHISPLPPSQQGGCSYTFFLTTTSTTTTNAKRGGKESEREGERKSVIVVQFRDLKHSLDRRVVEDVERVYGSGGLVPRVERMGEVEVEVAVREEDEEGMRRRVVQVVEMSLVEGVCVEDILREGVRSSCRSESERKRKREEWRGRMERLLCDVAGFFAVAWRDGFAGRGREGRKRVANGLIGSSIAVRLELLARDLPSALLRRAAEDTRRRFIAGGLSRLPIVFNHGDLLPRNLLVDPETWALTGILDWAESEDLPFGMMLYGVEHLLGFVEEEEETGKAKFVYYREADRLREVFWRRLRLQVSELAQPEMWEGMLLARRAGMLLWHGVAWDNGKRDRAVSVEHDAEDLAILEAFLESDSRPVQAKL